MSKQFTAQIFRWLNQVNADAELPATALKVCVELAGCFRESKKKGMAWPGLQTIADTIGKSKATVLSVIRILEQRGHLNVQHGRQGAGHSNHYWMVEKGQPADLSAQPKKVRKKGQPADLNLLKEASSEESISSPPPKSGREKLPSEAFSTPPQECGSPLRGSPPAEEETNTTPPERASPPEETIHAAWRELRALWARPWPERPREVGIARGELVHAVRAGADPMAIVDGAKRWVEAVEPRFLPPLWKWLEARGWDNEPPAKRRRRADVSAAASGYRRPLTPAEAMLRAGGED